MIPHYSKEDYNQGDYPSLYFHFQIVLNLNSKPKGKKGNSGLLPRHYGRPTDRCLFHVLSQNMDEKREAHPWRAPWCYPSPPDPHSDQIPPRAVLFHAHFQSRPPRLEKDYSVRHWITMGWVFIILITVMEIFSYSLMEEQTFNDIIRFLGEPKWTWKQMVDFLFRGREESSDKPATLESTAEVYWIFKSSGHAAWWELTQHSHYQEKLFNLWQGSFPKMGWMWLSLQDF